MNLTISPIAMTYAKMANSSTNQIQNPNNINFTAKQANKISSTDARIKELKAENQRLVEENKELRNQIEELKISNTKLADSNKTLYECAKYFQDYYTYIRAAKVTSIGNFMIRRKRDVNKSIVEALLSKEYDDKKLYGITYLIDRNENFNREFKLLAEVNNVKSIIVKSKLNKAGIFPSEDKTEFVYTTIKRALRTSPEAKKALKNHDSTELMKKNVLLMLKDLKIEPKDNSLEEDITVIFDDAKDFYDSLEIGITSMKEKKPNCIIKERIVDGDLEASLIGVKLKDARRTRYYKVENIARSVQNERMFNEET